MSEVSTLADDVNALADRFWNGILDLSPLTATMLGYDQGDDRLDDPGPAGRDRARALFRDTLAAADGIEARAVAAGSEAAEAAEAAASAEASAAAAAPAALPASGGVPPMAAVLVAGALVGAGYALRRRAASVD